METANIQSVVENNIVSVALMNIQPSSYNPRKHFDEVSLAELAESIRPLLGLHKPLPAGK